MLVCFWLSASVPAFPPPYPCCASRAFTSSSVGGFRGRGKRLIAEVDAGCVDLGLLHPGDGGFGLEISVAVKTLGEGRMCFRLENREEETRFVALDPLKAFAYLHLLEHCRFAVRDGVSGLLLPGKK